MRKVTLLLGLLCFWASVPAAVAQQPCEVVEAEACNIRKQPSCGPIDLFYWRPQEGTPQCGQVSVDLTPAGAIPQLRRLRCYFYGEDTRIRILAENYLPQKGPESGDQLVLRNGALVITIDGHYRSMSEPSRVMIENLGPAGSVILKCNGFGPA